jgi:hypothetical protein
MAWLGSLSDTDASAKLRLDHGTKCVIVLEGLRFSPPTGDRTSEAREEIMSTVIDCH